MAQRILVTSALPYANGPIHIGHLVEYIQTDVYVRFLKLIGEDVAYCCADDTHGTAIEMRAKKEGISAEELIDRVWKEHTADFAAYHIGFDSYYTTHSPENRAFADRIFTTLNRAGHIYTKSIEQTYCENCRRFLPDRYVKGKCPKCGAADQYGDVCEKCNATYTTAELKDPYCAICGATPVRRSSVHYFFRLSSFSEWLKGWLTSNTELQDEVRNYVLRWIDEGLNDWDISRDGPYFGFKIVGEEDKYYYVWLDAPIGYIASTQNFCNRVGRKVEDYWLSDESRIIHFIGKDIIYFHFLFWPAMLKGSGFRVPDSIIVHGHLVLGTEKMSKSRGTLITARDLLQWYDPEYLRFYYAKLLSRRLADLNLDFSDLKDKVNTELAANFGNLCNRTVSFLRKHFAGEVRGTDPDSGRMLDELAAIYGSTRENYLAVNLGGAVRRILEASSLANKYLQDAAPWAVIRKDRDRAQAILGTCASIVRDLGILFSPVLPAATARLWRQLGTEPRGWADLGAPLDGTTVGEPEILIPTTDVIPELGGDSKAREIQLVTDPAVEPLGLKVVLARLSGVQVKRKSKVLEQSKATFTKDLAPLAPDDPVLAEARRVYLSLGIAAIAPFEHLDRIVQEKNKLPQINTVVDAYNLVSLKRRLSVGAHDLSKITGDVHLRFGKESDHYVPLGESAPARVKENEFVFADDAGQVLCWLDVKQGADTFVEETTRDVLLIVQGNRAQAMEEVESGTREICELITASSGGTYEVEGRRTFPLDLRVGLIESVAEHPEAEKLYVLGVNLGYERRTIVAGLRPYLGREELLGEKLVIVANLKPRALRGIESQGMLLAGEKGKLVRPLLAKVALPGSSVTPDGFQVLGSEIGIEEFARVKLEVKGERVLYQGRPLRAGGEDITVRIEDGAKIR